MQIQFETPQVPERWADSRETDPMVAMAIHAIAGPDRPAEDIWDDPTTTELQTVRMACENYLAAGLFEASDDHHYCWGEARIRVLRPMIVPIWSVKADRDTGAWIGEPTDTGETAWFHEWCQQTDTDDVHFDTYEHFAPDGFGGLEIGSVTRAIRVEWT